MSSIKEMTTWTSLVSTATMISRTAGGLCGVPAHPPPPFHPVQIPSFPTQRIMNSPGIDLDMTLTSSPIRHDGDDDDGMNDKRGIFQPSTTTITTVHNNSHRGNDNNNNGNDNNNDGTMLVSENNNDDRGKGIITEFNSQLDDNSANNNVEERTNDNDNTMIVNGNITKKYNYKTMSMVELWREEISMMNVTNAILLNDLVKLGADV